MMKKIEIIKYNKFKVKKIEEAAKKIQEKYSYTMKNLKMD